MTAATTRSMANANRQIDWRRRALALTAGLFRTAGAAAQSPPPEVKQAAPSAKAVKSVMRYDVTMRRPDKLKVMMPGGGPASKFYYDGNRESRRSARVVFSAQTQIWLSP